MILSRYKYLYWAVVVSFFLSYPNTPVRNFTPKDHKTCNLRKLAKLFLAKAKVALIDLRPPFKSRSFAFLLDECFLEKVNEEICVSLITEKGGGGGRVCVCVKWKELWRGEGDEVGRFSLLQVLTPKLKVIASPLNSSLISRKIIKINVPQFQNIFLFHKEVFFMLCYV